MQYAPFQKEISHLLPHLPVSNILARTLALQIHYEEKSVGDLFVLLDQQLPETLTNTELSHLATLLETGWNWLQALNDTSDLPFLTKPENSAIYLEERRNDLRDYLQIALGIDEDQLLHYEEEQIERLTLTVKMLRDLNAIEAETLTPDQAVRMGKAAWKTMFDCRPSPPPDQERESLLTPQDQAYLALREVHFEGSWDEMLATLEQIEELAADLDPEAVSRLQYLEDEGHNLLEVLPPEVVGLIDTALQLNREWVEWSNEEPQNTEELAVQNLARLLLFRDERAEQAWEELLVLGTTVREPLRKLLDDMLCQHVLGPGFGLNFNRLVKLAGELDITGFQRELMGLLQTPLPRVLDAVADIMTATPENFLPLLQTLLCESEHDLSHFNGLLVLHGFTLESRLKMAERLLQVEQTGDDREWGAALLRFFNSLEKDSARLVRQLIEQSRDSDTRLYLQQLQELDSSLSGELQSAPRSERDTPPSLPRRKRQAPSESSVTDHNRNDCLK
ncbi:MAG: hypothetical protein ISR91_05675 [Candidatus Delongbacteria bacterium]|nr:hypothetical protein [bacterium]MBL7033618.1 hypothetical protein [Candidatus Delongbacteria bacterium]